MDIYAAFPSRFLKAADLGDAAPIVTIDRVEIQSVGGGQGQTKEDKPVVYFRGKEKGLVLNKVNSKTIAGIASTRETEDWPGVQIQLFVAQVEFAGELMSAIRVQSPRNVAPAGRPSRTKSPEVEPRESVGDDDSVPF